MEEETTMQQTEALVLRNGDKNFQQDSLTYLPKWSDTYRQILGACVIHLITIQAGVNLAFSAILLPQLNKTDSDIKIDPSEGAWIASLVTISLPIGSLISGPLMDRFGRKNLALLTCIPYLISWILIFWAYNVYWLYVGRVLIGAAAGFANVAIYYTSETTHPVWRSMLLGLISVFVSFGILLTAIFGTWFHWRTVAAIFAFLNGCFFFLISILPESPHWFLAFGEGIRDVKRIQCARKSVKWFNSNDMQAEMEFEQLLSNYRNVKKVSSPETKDETTFREKFLNFMKPEMYKPSLLLMAIFFFQQNSGSYVIIFYAVDIFGYLGIEYKFLDKYTAMVLLGFIRFIAAVIALLISKKYGRRTLLIVSGLGMGISLLTAALCLEFGKSETKIVTFASVLSFVSFAAVGWQIIPWSLTGELLPTKIRGTMGGIITSYAYLLMFIAVQTFPALIKEFEIKGAMWLYSCVSFVSTLFVWKYLPETFGKSLAEIENFFKT